jgi:GDSL-like Lipase/Acylhydrolase family
MPHLALFGDSIFDNKAYTHGAPDVIAHLRSFAPADWKSTLYAVDGATSHDVGRQFDRLNASVSHIVLSLGGNDALMHAELLDHPVRSTGEALEIFYERTMDFQTSYGYALEALLALGRPVQVCTIYNGNLGGVDSVRATMALTLWNDVILRSALKFGLDVIELRMVCTELADFANPLEPSNSGGRKIAQAIARAFGFGEAAKPRTVVTAG